jgi:hypothetical protein
MNTRDSMSSKLNGRTIAIGVVILLAAIFILPRLFNTDSVAQPNQPSLGNENFGNQNQPLDGNIALGNPVSAAAVDRDGCPVETTSQFSASNDIYVVAPNSSVPQGTSVFVRLYREGQPIEDAPEIIADRDYDNTCINFVFEPVNQPFESGSYEAEFFINGNAADTISFDVR